MTAGRCATQPESLWVAVGSGRGGLRHAAHDDVGLCGRQTHSAMSTASIAMTR